MKSERRHELKQNELARDLALFLERLQPYWRAIAGVAVVMATGAFAVAFVSATQRKTQEAGWTQFYEAVGEKDVDGLERVAEAQRGNSVAPWAQLAAAQARLIRGSELVYTQREEARKELLKAVDGFNAVLGQSNEDLPRQRALFGLGQAHEGLNELSQAKEAYEKLSGDFDKAALADEARQRVAALNDPRTKAFCDWFFAQTPPPPRLPASGEVPNLPFSRPTGVNTPQSSDLDPSSGLDFGDGESASGLELAPPENLGGEELGGEAAFKAEAEPQTTAEATGGDAPQTTRP